MSCGNPDAVPIDGEPKEETLMPKKKTIDSRICIRCKDRKGSMVLGHYTYCRECLALLVVAKFTRLLFPHLPPLSRKPDTPTPSILLACSGGSASISMLELFHRAFCQSTSTKSRTGRARWGRIVVGFVDFGHEEQTRADKRWTSIKALAEKYEWETWKVKVEEAFDKDGELINDKGGLNGTIGVNVLPGRVLKTTHLPNANPTSSYHSLLAQLPVSSHPSLRFQLLSSLLTRMAYSLSTAPSPTPTPPLLLTGLTSTRSASLVVSALASGRGYSLPLLVSSSFEAQGVNVIRPLGGLGKKELAWYARERGLPSWDLDWDSGVGIGEDGKGGKSSIEALTQEFIQTLNTTHPSTVSTIARTASKLVFPGYLPPSHDSSQARPSSCPRENPWAGRVCPICELPADQSPLEWLATTSITSLSSQSSPPTSPSQTHSEHETTTPGKTPTMPLEDKLCYACLTTLVSPSAASRTTKLATDAQVDESEPFAPLPSWVLGNLVGEVNKEKKKGEKEGQKQVKVEREQVENWLKEEGWLLNDDNDDDVGGNKD